MYLNTFIGGNVCDTAKQAQERGGGQGLVLITPDRVLVFQRKAENLVYTLKVMENIKETVYGTLTWSSLRQIRFRFL
jgi:hypothetical protein